MKAYKQSYSAKRPATRERTTYEQEQINTAIAWGDNTVKYYSINLATGKERVSFVPTSRLNSMQAYEGFSFRIEKDHIDPQNYYCGMCGYPEGTHHPTCEVYED